MVQAKDSDDLLRRFGERDRRALARVLSLVQDGADLDIGQRPQQAARVVGITGSGGAGKSTLVGALVGHLRRRGLRVAVLACDPQSPKTGGALLGDRIRVKMDPADDGVYFRSLSTRGAPGGVAACTGEAVPWLKAFGFDVILVETVGTGQDQTAVREVVDTLVLLVTPGAGDEIQWEKAGVIELADIIAINKSDMPGADRVRQQLVHALSLSPGQDQAPPVLALTATTGAGVAELWNAIEGLKGRPST